MTRTTLLLLFAALFAALPAFAQPTPTPLTAYGKVGKLPLVSFCMDGAQYKLENSNLRMKDDPKNGVDASKFVGQWVRVEGKFGRGLISPSCDLMALTKIAASTEYLEEKGSSLVPGGAIHFSLYGRIGSLQALLMGAGPPAKTLMPLGPFGLLVLSLQGPIYPLATTPIPATGVVPLKLPLPNDPALKGGDLTFQSAAGVFGPTLAAYLLNPQTVRIQ